MVKDIIVRKTSEVGTYFFNSFSINNKVGIGTLFTTNNGANTWVIGRIDNITVVDDLIHVEGYCINEESFNS